MTFSTFAPMIDQQTIDRIFAAADIVEIVNDYVTLKRKGVNYEACCPFHNEKTPSFKVSPSKGIFRCFGCGKSGNAVTFVMEHEALSYPEALRLVAKKYGIEIKEKEQTEEDIQRNNNRESMLMLNSWASEYFADYLHNNEEGISIGLTYFRQARGFSEATIRKFCLGFCPSEWGKMSQDALRAGYKEEFLLSTGLAIKNENRGDLSDRFRERVIFPIHNISGRVVGFGGRTLLSKEEQKSRHIGKYQNSPESEVYSKSREIYGLYFAKKALQQQDNAIVVEGYADVLSMHQSGIENVVASSGTAFTVEQIRLLARFSNNITLMFDGDVPGQKAALKHTDPILKEGLNVRVVVLPEEHDPDTFARAYSADEVRNYIAQNSLDFMTFKTRLLLSDAQNDPIKRSEVIKSLVVSISLMPDNIKRSIYIKECAKIMDIDENVLVNEVARERLRSIGDKEAEEFVRRQTQRQRAEQRQEAGVAAGEQIVPFGEVSAGSSEDALECEIVYYLLAYGDKNFEFKEGKNYVSINVASLILDEMALDEMSLNNRVYNAIFEIFRKAHEEGRYPEPHEYIAHPDPEVCSMAIKILTQNDDYTESEIWTKKEVHSISESEVLSVGVPKVMKLFKTKRVTKMIEELQRRLCSEGISEDEQLAIMAQIDKLNRAKVILTKQLKRLTV